MIDGSSSQEFPPEQRKALFDKSGDDCNYSECRKDPDVKYRLAAEFSLFAIGDRGHEVTAYVAVDNVQATEREQERHERGKHHSSFPAHCGSKEDRDRSHEAKSGYL
jgi:hypothetical protein